MSDTSQAPALVRTPVIYDADMDRLVSGRYPSPEARRDIRNAVAHARVTGSVGATYNDMQVSRLYVVKDGTNTATTLWLVGSP